MIPFVLRRTLSGIVVLLAVACLAFALLYASGGNVARNMLGDQASEDSVSKLQEKLGLNHPFIVQLANWMTDAVHGDLGTSWFTSEPVTDAILSRLPVTLTLVVVAMVVIAVLATLLGILAAVRRGWVDRVVQSAAIAGDAVPNFVLAIGLVTLFGIQLKLFPAISSIAPGGGAAAWLASMTLPVIALVVNGVTTAAQQVRSAIIKQLEKDYVRTLRSRGIPQREILFRHVLRSAAPAGLTVLSLQFIAMLGGVVIIEQIFALPGIGPLAVQATTMGDIPLVMGVVLSTGVIVIVVNLLVDLANGWLNPKVRLS